MGRRLLRKIVFNSLVMLAALGLGLTAGFLLRGKRVAHVREEPADVSVQQTASPLNSSAATRRKDDSPLATKLEHDLAMSEGVTRWLYWMEAIDNAGINDFPRLAQLAKGNPAALRLLAQHWVELNPYHFFNTLVGMPRNGGAGELETVLFDEWPRRNAEAAIAALNGLPDSGLRQKWRLQVATSVFSNDVERALQLLSEWRLEEYEPPVDALRKWAAGDPRHAAEVALANPIGHASPFAVETMEIIGQEWAKSDPRGALEFAVRKTGGLGSELASVVLKEWAGRNFNQAADWLAGTDTPTRTRLGPSFVESWAAEDARSALAWCETNLPRSGLARAVGGVFKGAAEKDVIGAAELVTTLIPSPARAEGAVAVARKWWAAPDESVRRDAVVWLGRLDNQSIKRVLDEVAWGWATSDPGSMAGFLAARTGDEIPRDNYGVVAQELARKNPLEALEWANRLPADRALAAGSDAFAAWRLFQPESALKWLNELPASDLRHESFFKAAIRALAYDPQAPTRVAAMGAAERAAARATVETLDLSKQARAGLFDLLKDR